MDHNPAVALRVGVEPSVLRWASERSRIDPAVLAAKFPKLPEWEQGDAQPTLKQLEKFANTTHTPFGFLLLPAPPVETLPVPDFRTHRDAAAGRPSPDLLETIYLCEQRQEWYRDFARGEGEQPLPYVGRLSTETEPSAPADAIREDLGIDAGAPALEEASSWSDGFRALRDQAEAVGVLVMVSGITGANTRRKLDPEEFRGFALVDDLAPVVFVNGADSKAAQIFTLAHELAHIWLGSSAVSDARLNVKVRSASERWCNEVAAELLVPLADFRTEFRPRGSLSEELQRLARTYRVSTLVILRRVRDLGHLTWEQYGLAFETELQRIRDLPAAAKVSGGDFYNTQPTRVSKRFARAIVGDTLEGRTLYGEAYRLLGVKKHATFEALRDRIGIA